MTEYVSMAPEGNWSKGQSHSPEGLGPPGLEQGRN